MKQEEIDMIAHAKRGVLTLCIGTNTGENIAFSLAVAEQIGKTLNRGKVLYLNTVHTERQLASEIRKRINPDYSVKNSDPRITYLTCAGGTLNTMDDAVRT